MDLHGTYIIEEFLSNKKEVFTFDEFYKHIKSCGVKVPKQDAFSLLTSSEMVFQLVGNEFVTRTGVFSGRWFSFMPTKEEIDKGYILLGHRCMPFVNPAIAPDSITVTNSIRIIESEPVSFSMNLALDLFALYGEGYVLPFIFNDHSNKTYPLTSIQYSMPNEITLTAWSLDKLGNGEKVEYGDRILCRVLNWEENIVELNVVKHKKSLAISEADIEREEWYANFEEAFFRSFNKNGPANSIEEQLAFLILENQELLCCVNCGSIEDVLKHSKKLALCPYGVESRIWKTGEDVPFVGEWNKEFGDELILTTITEILSPSVVDAFLENSLHIKESKGLELNLEDLARDFFPPYIKFSPSQKKSLILNMQKRFDILKKAYNSFSDYELAPVRSRVLDLFKKVSELLSSVGESGLKPDIFPQQELVILVQLFGHLVRVIEEMENVLIRDRFPIADVKLSLEGMEETFDGIGSVIRKSLEVNTYKNITIIS